MSRPPGIVDRVNYVVETWSNPCDAPWIVYAETALPALLDVAIALVCFDVGDVARFIFRPANLRTDRHGRSRRKGQSGRKPKGIRYRLAQKFPAFAKLQQRKISQGVKHLWVIDGIGQRLMWWWLMIDVATGFAYNWTTMIYKSERCQMALAPGAASREADWEIYSWLQSPATVRYDFLLYESGSVNTTLGGFNSGPGAWGVVGSLLVENLSDVPIIVELQVRLKVDGEWEVHSGGEVNLGGHEEAGLVASASVDGELDGHIRLLVNRERVQGKEGFLYVQGQPASVPPPTRFTCNSPFFPP